MNGPIDDTLVVPMIKAFRPCEAERALLWLLTRAKYDYRRAIVTSQMSQKELARLAFNGNEAQAERSLKRLGDLDLIERIERGYKGHASIYRLSAKITPQKAEIAPRKELKPPQNRPDHQAKRLPSYLNKLNQKRSDRIVEHEESDADRRIDQRKPTGSGMHQPW